MKKKIVLKQFLTVVIVLLCCCGKSWSRVSDYPLYGGISDSVLVSYDDIRAANAKMVELNYEKLKNQNLSQIIANDSVIIATLHESIAIEKKATKKAKLRERIAEGVGLAAIIGLIVSICK